VPTVVATPDATTKKNNNNNKGEKNMATKVMKTLSIYRQEGKEGVIVERAPGEKGSQTYQKGAPLVYDSAEIEIWAGGTTTTRIIGIAAKDATGTAASAVPYYEANDYNLFEGSLTDGTDAYTLLGTEVGTAYSLVASSNDWYVDVGDTDTAKVEVVGLIDAVGDVNPRVIVRFLGGMQSRVLQS
jgi:hypothetical protein